MEWSPSTSSEYVAELDERWTPVQIAQAASSDWRSLAAELVAKRCIVTVAPEQLHAFRSPSGQPRIWTCKVKLSPETGEKLLCSSSQEGQFVRPLDPAADPAPHYTIVWGPRHQDASLQSLSTFLEFASKCAANRGVSRSLVGLGPLGLRVRWGDVHQTRLALRLGDPSLTPETLGLHDQRHFRMQGVPNTASLLLRLPVSAKKWSGRKFPNRVP